MKKLISYPFSAIALIVFLLVLVVFHPIQWVCFNVFGYQAHKKSVDYLNFILLKVGLLIGTTFKFDSTENIPKNVPLIIVANHQSLYDIVGIIWYMRRFHPKFVSKKELGKGIPSISYNLRHGGSVLIDRKDPKQALSVIKNLGIYIEKTKRSAMIFPEGTRTKTGVPKPFSQTGVKILCKNAPSAFVVPISINNSWEFVKYGMFPYGLGNCITFTIHKPLAVSEFTFDELMQKTEEVIVEGIKYKN